MTVELPLTGLRVVDLTDQRAELAARLLADLGADVVRVEPPGGSTSRRIGPFHDGESVFHAVRNTNKRLVTLALDDADDRRRFLDLLDGADIWIDGRGPNDRAAVDPADVVARRPGLVITSVTDFGLTGPYRDYVATDPVMVGMSWMLFRAGTTDYPPVLPPGAFAHDIAGIVAAFASLTGYLQKLRTGDGRLIDLSVIEAVQGTTDWGLASYSAIAAMMGNAAYSQIRSGGGNVYPVIPCKDGWVRPAIVTTPEWHKMRSWMGEPEILQDSHWDIGPNRYGIFEDVIKPMFIEFFADKTMIEASEEGQNRRIPITPLLRPRDVLEAEQYAVLETFADGEVAPGVKGPVASGFYRFDGERVGYRTAAPALDDGAAAWADEPVTFVPALEGDASATGPFAGVRVLDFGVAGAAPEVARLLGEYGADVIRVETPHRPDLFRVIAGGGVEGVSPVFASSNRTKRSFSVDFREPEGVELIRRLVAASDIVVENLPPGTMDKWGLAYDDLRAANPDVLLISSQTMGTVGPWRNWRGYGANTQPPGGMTYLWSFPDVPEPVASNVAFPDHVVGRLGATLATALLIAKERRSSGLHAEIVQGEVAINLMAHLFLKEALEPGSVGPAGNRSDRGAPWGAYRCAGEERWCVITCRDDDDWQRLREAIGTPAWSDDPALAGADGRRADQDRLDAHLGEWTAQRSDREVMETLQAAGVPAGMMMYVGDIPSDPHLLERGYVLHLEQQGVGPMMLEGPGFHADGLPGPLTTPAPLMGQHTGDIAAAVLGLDQAEITALVERGILYT